MAEPACNIRIDGSRIPPGLVEDLVSVEVVEELARTCCATIVVRNWDPDKGETQLAEGEGGSSLAVGMPVTIELGYGTKTQEVFTGLIVALRSRFEATSVPTLEVECRCDGIRLHGIPRTRLWTEQSDYSVVSEICQQAGFGASGSDGESLPILTQYRTSDWQYILERSRSLGFPLYVRQGKLSFQAPNASSEAVAALRWGLDIISLDLSEDLRNAVAQATARAWDPETKAAVTGQTSASGASFSTGSRSTTSTMLSNAGLTDAWQVEHADSGALSQSEVTSLSQAIVDARSLNAYHGVAECLGNPALRIDNVLSVTGVGTSYDGDYYITRCRHVYRPGRYRSMVEVGRPPDPLVARARSSNRMPPMAGPVIGKVESFEDSDKKQARVQISFPWMAGDPKPVWARLATPAGGPDRGFVYVPEPGDEVAVAFLDDDPRFPVVIGAFWNGVDAPPDTYDAENNSKRSLVSKTGHKLVLDDSDDAPQVLVQTNAGQQVLLDDTSGSESIELQDKTGNSVKMSSDGISLTAAAGANISIEAASGSIKLSAQSVTVQGESEAKLSAGSVTVQGESELSMSGGMVSISGEGELSASAPMIKLN
ncbi:MAG: phage baseplate assembly protein V [Planctomycetota bacterium]